MFLEAAMGESRKKPGKFKVLENDNCGEQSSAHWQRKITIDAQLDEGDAYS